MNEWFKKTLEKIKTLWAKWSVVQKIILVGIIVGVIVGFVLLFSVSSAPTTVSVYGVAIGNATELDNISTFLSETGIKHSISDGKIFVDDEKTANKARTEISVAGLSPRNFDPWDYLGSDSWAGSDFKNDQNVQKRVMDMLTEHIRSLDDISDANVILTFPKEALFSSEQEPVKASVAIRVKKGSDILENKKRLKGLQSLIVQAVDGLKEENITITDMATGEILNDFSSMKNFDDVDLAEREFKLLSDEEEKYKQKIATALYQTFGKNELLI